MLKETVFPIPATRQVKRHEKPTTPYLEAKKSFQKYLHYATVLRLASPRGYSSTCSRRDVSVPVLAAFTIVFCCIIIVYYL